MQSISQVVNTLHVIVIHFYDVTGQKTPTFVVTQRQKCDFK